MDNLSKILLVLAIAFIPLRYGPIYFWPNILLVIASGFLFFLTFLFSKKNGDTQNKHTLFWIKIFILFFIFYIIGSINSYFIYGLDILAIKNTAIYLFLIGVNISYFLLIIYYNQNKNLTRPIINTIFVPIIFVVFIFLPQIASDLAFVAADNKFEGFNFANPSTFASIMLLPLLYLIIILFEEKRITQKIGYSILTTLCISILIWTGIRSAWFSLAISIAFLSIFQVYYTRQLKRAFKNILLIFIMIIIASTILPERARISSLSRIFPQISQDKATSFIGYIKTIIKNPSISIPHQNRLAIYTQSTKLFIKNPFGLGPQYGELSKKIADDTKIANKFTGSNNSFLEIGLSGGVGALIIFCFLIIKVFKNTMNNFHYNKEWLFLSTAFISLFVITFFQGDLQNINWLWIISALIISKNG